MGTPLCHFPASARLHLKKKRFPLSTAGVQTILHGGAVIQSMRSRDSAMVTDLGGHVSVRPHSGDLPMASDDLPPCHRILQKIEV